MGEKSKTEPEALPVGSEGSVNDEASEKPQAPVVRTRAAADPKRLLFIAGALLILAVAAASAGLALYCLSRSSFNRNQRAAFEDLQQSLQRMEQHIVAVEARNAAASGERTVRSGPESSGLLDAANLRYREGQFDEAVASYRAAMDMNLAGSFTDETHYRYAQSLLKTGRFDQALAEFQSIEVSFPGSSYFASAAMEAAQLLFQKKSYSQARRVLYELMAVKDRLSPAEKAGVERAYFFVAQCYEAEAASLEEGTHAPLSRLESGRSADAAALPINAAAQPSLPDKSMKTEGK
jgi:tetratricopeptide (TPR) repeat protein